MARILGVDDNLTIQETETSLRPEAEDYSDIGTLQSIFAGLGSGLIQIPKGVMSLGASVYDLVNDTDKAAEIERYFDDLTELDEMAEATTAGKIAELLVNVGVPGGVGFKVGSSLANAAVRAKKAGNYFKITGEAGKKLKKGADVAAELNKKGKAAKFFAGTTAGGIAEGVFIGDVENAGTIGDALGGFTELERAEDGSNDPMRDIINRVKFGTEGALFTGVLGGTGAIIKNLAKRGNELQYSNDLLDKFYDKIGGALRARGKKTEEFFKLERAEKGLRSGDTIVAKNISRDTDKLIDSVFPAWRTVANSQSAKNRNIFLEEVNDLLTSGKPTIDKQGKVTFEFLDPSKKKFKVSDTIRKHLDGKKATEVETELFANINAIRNRWQDLFSKLGGRLEDKELAEFKKLFGTKFKNYLGSTYEVFQNKSILPFLSYTPSREAIKATEDLFIATGKQQGKTVTREQAQGYVKSIIDTAKLPSGFKMDKPNDPFFKIPTFFAGKTAMKDVADFNGTINIANITKQADREVFENLLGKNKNPMQTILAGTSKLSVISRRNVFFDNIIQESDALKAGGKRGMVYDTYDEAVDALGTDIKQIRIDLGKKLEAGVVNPLNGKYALRGVADALEETSTVTKDPTFLTQVYNNLVLYPKATSQIAKTILSPVTHLRNFVSAGAFAAANGILPLNPLKAKAIKNAYQALQTPLKGTRRQNEFYEELLELGVVNSNVRLGDLSRLMEDVNFGSTMTTDKGMRLLLKPLSKLKSVSQDLYTAEDDFWKIYSFAVEKDRLGAALARNLKVGEMFTDRNGVQRVFRPNNKNFERYLKEEAADIVKNNIPNYDYVSEFIQGLRKAPIGNFVSFPAEILRTGTNIVRRALSEINGTVTKADGTVIKPFQRIGYQRLFGFGATVAAVPAGAVELGKTLYDVTDDEVQAIRRYVADWSKNSTIIPIKDKETGKFKYVDFSHANAYDTLIRPIQSVINQVAIGEKDNDGMMDDFVLGAFIGMREIGEPFISESIWTEAVLDLIARGGRTRSGSEVFNPEDLPGTKASKIMKHLVEAQMPFSLNQLKRIDRSIKEVDVITKGRFDEYGQDYEFGPEFAGLFGFRAIELDPAKSIQYKIFDYNNGVSDSRKLFTSVTLKGGPIEPYEVIDAYLNANRALFGVRKEMKADIDAAKLLGLEGREFYDSTTRLTKSDLANLEGERFVPFGVSDGVIAKFDDNTRKLREKDPSYENPFRAAANVLFNIRNQMFRIKLTEGSFPFFENPLLPKGGGADAANMQGSVITAPIDGNLLSSQVQQTNSTNAQRFATLFPNG